MKVDSTFTHRHQQLNIQSSRFFLLYFFQTIPASEWSWGGENNPFYFKPSIVVVTQQFSDHGGRCRRNLCFQQQQNQCCKIVSFQLRYASSTLYPCERVSHWVVVSYQRSQELASLLPKHSLAVHWIQPLNPIGQRDAFQMAQITNHI